MCFHLRRFSVTFRLNYLDARIMETAEQIIALRDIGLEVVLHPREGAADLIQRDVAAALSPFDKTSRRLRSPRLLCGQQLRSAPLPFHPDRDCPRSTRYCAPLAPGRVPTARCRPHPIAQPALAGRCNQERTRSAPIHAEGVSADQIRGTSSTVW